MRPTGIRACAVGGVEAQREDRVRRHFEAPVEGGQLGPVQTDDDTRPPGQHQLRRGAVRLVDADQEALRVVRIAEDGVDHDVAVRPQAGARVSQVPATVGLHRDEG